jgi:mannose-6-phosphate isomerase-like protein (cupin superfamily)
MQDKEGKSEMNQNFTAQSAADAEYKIGDRDFSRGWGGYEVTDVEQDASGNVIRCEKDITVRPGQALSLQSHDHRRELWTVVSGELTVVLDGDRLTLNAGEDVRIPLGGIHCMANLSKVDVVVHEVQEGVCREIDIHRFKDMYGRPAEQSSAPNVVSSLKVYNDILNEIASTVPSPSAKP